MPWTQVVVLKTCVAAHKKATGDSDEALAKKLGTTAKTLKFWMSGARSPKKSNLQRMSEVFGVSVTRFLDDPGQEVAGRTAETKTEQRRVIGGMMWDSLMDDGLSDEDASLLFEDFIASKSRLQALKARVKPSNS